MDFPLKERNKAGAQGGGHDYFGCLSLVLGAEKFILQSPGKCWDCEIGTHRIHPKNHNSDALDKGRAYLHMPDSRVELSACGWVGRRLG